MTPYTIQSIEFSRAEYWSGYLFPSPGDLPNSGIEPRSPAMQANSLPAVDNHPKCNVHVMGIQAGKDRKSNRKKKRNKMRISLY